MKPERNRTCGHPPSILGTRANSSTDPSATVVARLPSSTVRLSSVETDIPPHQGRPMMIHNPQLLLPLER
jgi:hypothetical protein